MEIAKEENVPPYIVFSDKTLNDMCIKLPFTPEEMLTVTGVGQNKKEKYGERFSELILQVTGGNREGYSWIEPNLSIIPETEKKGISNSSASVQRKQENTTIKGNLPKETNSFEDKSKSSTAGKGKKKKEEFHFTRWMAERIDCEGDCMLSEFVKKLNQQIDEKQMKRLTAVSIEKKLEEQDYIHCEYHLRPIVIVKKKGKEQGFFVAKRISQNGNEYDVLMLNPQTQRWLLEKVVEKNL